MYPWALRINSSSRHHRDIAEAVRDSLHPSLYLAVVASLAAAVLAGAAAGGTSAVVARVTPREGRLARLVTRGWRGEGGDLTMEA